MRVLNGEVCEGVKRRRCKAEQLYDVGCHLRVTVEVEHKVRINVEVEN